mgnify:FL=1
MHKKSDPHNLTFNVIIIAVSLLALFVGIVYIQKNPHKFTTSEIEWYEETVETFVSQEICESALQGYTSLNFEVLKQYMDLIKGCELKDPKKITCVKSDGTFVYFSCSAGDLYMLDQRVKQHQSELEVQQTAP